jgi:hypothetical protein
MCAQNEARNGVHLRAKYVQSIDATGTPVHGRHRRGRGHMRFEEEDGLWRILQRETLTLEDVKFLFRHTGNREQEAERIIYANSLLPEAGDYLRP